MQNVNQQAIKTLEDRQSEIYEAKEKINKELVDLKNREKELNRQMEELKNQQRNLLSESQHSKVEYIRKHKDIILPLFKHIGDCSDENPYNGIDMSDYSGYTEVDCPRCALIQLLDYSEYTYGVDFDFSLDLKIIG